MTYSWSDFNSHPGAGHLSSEVARMPVDSAQDAFMSEGYCNQTFPSQAQPPAGQWTSYSISPDYAYSPQDPVLLSVATDPYSPCFSPPTSPSATPADKNSAQTAREQRRRAQNRASQGAFRDRKNQQMRHLEQNLAELQDKHEKLLKSSQEGAERPGERRGSQGADVSEGQDRVGGGVFAYGGPTSVAGVGHMVGGFLSSR